VLYRQSSSRCTDWAALEMINCKTGMILLNIATSPCRARSVDPTEFMYNLHISRKIVVYYEEIKRECMLVYVRQSMQHWCVCVHQCAMLHQANVYASPTVLPYSNQYDSLRTDLKNMLQRQTRVVKQINFTAGGRSLNLYLRFRVLPKV
jgi:hypothetical protein